MALLWCSKCKRNQETIEVSHEEHPSGGTVKYQCVVCCTYIRVSIVKRSGKHTGRPYRCWEG